MPEGRAWIQVKENTYSRFILNIGFQNSGMWSIHFQQTLSSAQWVNAHSFPWKPTFTIFPDFRAAYFKNVIIWILIQVERNWTLAP